MLAHQHAHQGDRRNNPTGRGQCLCLFLCRLTGGYEKNVGKRQGLSLPVLAYNNLQQGTYLPQLLQNASSSRRGSGLSLPWLLNRRGSGLSCLFPTFFSYPLSSGWGKDKGSVPARLGCCDDHSGERVDGLAGRGQARAPTEPQQPHKSRIAGLSNMRADSEEARLLMRTSL